MKNLINENKFSSRFTQKNEISQVTPQYEIANIIEDEMKKLDINEI
jgi:hypothetical protein